MAGFTTNSDRIGKPPRVLHAGLVHDVAVDTWSATASLTCVSNMLHIPRGCRIANVYLIANNNGGGTGAESILVKSLTHNKVYLSATFALAAAGVGSQDSGATKVYADADYVYTASDTLVLETRNTVGTGTANISFKLQAMYTVDQDQV